MQDLVVTLPELDFVDCLHRIREWVAGRHPRECRPNGLVEREKHRLLLVNTASAASTANAWRLRECAERLVVAALAHGIASSIAVLTLSLATHRYYLLSLVCSFYVC